MVDNQYVAADQLRDLAAEFCGDLKWEAALVHKLPEAVVTVGNAMIQHSLRYKKGDAVELDDMHVALILYALADLIEEG